MAVWPVAPSRPHEIKQMGGPRSATPVLSRFFADSPSSPAAAVATGGTVDCDPSPDGSGGRRRRSNGGSSLKRKRQQLSPWQPSAAEDPSIRRLPMGWRPPRSPHHLIEEWLWHQPWQLLVACILLNKTTGIQVLNHQVLPRIISRWPHPSCLANADIDELEAVLRPLGLYRNRARSLRRFSAEYMFTDWDFPIELHGIGRYADDAYRIFCLGLVEDTNPADKELRKYVNWYRAKYPKSSPSSAPLDAAASVATGENTTGHSRFFRVPE